MGGESYAIPVTSVREVLTVPKVTRIPRMPDFMRGVVNLRGLVVPILDLKLKFGGGETETASDTAIIVVEIPFAGEDKNNELHHKECKGRSIPLRIAGDPPKEVLARLEGAGFIAANGECDGPLDLAFRA